MCKTVRMGEETYMCQINRKKTKKKTPLRANSPAKPLKCCSELLTKLVELLTVPLL